MRNSGSKLKYAIIACVGWFPIAIYSIFIKNVNIELRYFSLFYKFSDIGENPAIRDHLFIYNSDILYSFLLIPLLIIGIVYLFPKRKTIAAIVLLSITILFLLFANMHSWGTMGKPLSYSALIDAAVFALQSPKFITMYVDYNSWGKFLILFVATIIGYTSAKKVSETKYLNSLVVSAVLFSFIMASVLAGLGMMSDMKKAKIFNNFIFLSLEEFLDKKAAVSEVQMSGDEVIDSFSQLTNTIRDTTSPYTAKAKGNDLILLILETGPVEFIDLENDIESFPTINRLKKNSLISYNHYATYPGSAQSLFSLFFSIYPPLNYYQSCIAKQDNFEKPFPGIVSKLAEIGYRTNLYLPYKDVIPLDIILHNNIGAQKIYFAEDFDLDESNYDLMALEQMKNDMNELIDQNQPYVSIFLPQLGHAPWKDRPSSVSIKEYGRKLAIEQDKWIAEIVDLLKEKNKLATTTIVITADHGIRTAKEDPAFNMGFIDDYSFHVPLMIFSKSSFHDAKLMEAKTSHLDISPSLIDLFGLSDSGLLQQGLKIWDSNIENRDLYFLGNWHCDADGYYSSNSYYMYNEVLGLSFQNNSLNFLFENVVRDDELAKNVQDNIQNIYMLQDSLYSSYLCE